MKKNQDVRQAVEAAKIRYWQLADALEMSPQKLSTTLRHELDEKTKSQYIAAIERAKNEE